MDGVDTAANAASEPPTFVAVQGLHDRHHFGVDRTLELSRHKLGLMVTRRLVRKVVSQ